MFKDYIEAEEYMIYCKELKKYGLVIGSDGFHEVYVKFEDGCLWLHKNKVREIF